MEAAPAEPTKSEFLRAKMTNLIGFLCEKLEPLRLPYPQLFSGTPEEIQKTFNTFGSDEEKEKKNGELFDQTKHFCLNLLGGVPFNTEGNSLEKAQSILMMRNIVTILVAQAVTAKHLHQAVLEAKKTGAIHPSEEIDLNDPTLLGKLLNDEEKLALKSLVGEVTKGVLTILKDDDYLRLCLYFNCFVDIVTNL